MLWGKLPLTWMKEPEAVHAALAESTPTPAVDPSTGEILETGDSAAVGVARSGVTT